ncbi:hypothetical protein BO79DRAFT_223776 [Aspergillus costaricaensis CBS 115574]|uniref:Uncharacterized protein n=1 Tax=Aspergillus costaricaensis CBS 115574 TaxID=1448317 RepID=A0ACD1IVR0_9EURO|nr:hypothetical protein BO79DRAFT_223776 [Aspergillus costaricaensis CBS 115574]RAK94730.1 hypothetical protein BO79DRAFT_223776 [Aspergillus costaricaensis CBS 115574]
MNAEVYLQGIFAYYGVEEEEEVEEDNADNDDDDERRRWMRASEEGRSGGLADRERIGMHGLLIASSNQTDGTRTGRKIRRELLESLWGRSISIKSGQLKSDQAESGSVRVSSQSVPHSLSLIHGHRKAQETG